VRMPEKEIRLNPPSTPVHRRRLSDSTDSNYERSLRIVEMDTCHLRSLSSRMAGRYTPRPALDGVPPRSAGAITVLAAAGEGADRAALVPAERPAPRPRPPRLQDGAQHAPLRARAAAVRLARQEHRRIRPQPDQHAAADAAPGRARQPAVHGEHRVLRGADAVPQRAEAAPAAAEGGRGVGDPGWVEEVVPARARRPLLPVLQCQPQDGWVLRPQRRRRGGQRLLPGQLLVTTQRDAMSVADCV
jgi:hypothetical protein